MIPCPGCRKKINPKAASCPHCGLPYPAKARARRSGNGVRLLLFIAAILGAWIAWVQPDLETVMADPMSLLRGRADMAQQGPSDAAWRTALAAVKREGQVMDVSRIGSAVYAGVAGGGSRDGLARRLCGVLASHGVYRATVHVADVAASSAPDEGRVIGRARCN